MLILLTACLGTVCIQEVTPVAQPNPSACIMAVPQVVNSFEDNNPEWTVKSWECVDPKVIYGR